MELGCNLIIFKVSACFFLFCCSGYLEKVAELKTSLTKIILDERTTSGLPQKDDGMEGWR